MIDSEDDKTVTNEVKSTNSPVVGQDQQVPVVSTVEDDLSVRVMVTNTNSLVAGVKQSGIDVGKQDSQADDDKPVTDPPIVTQETSKIENLDPSVGSGNEVEYSSSED